MTATFASTENFLAPVLTSDGKPFGPIRYKTLLREVYAIIKNVNVTYSEALNMTPTERSLLMSFISNDMKKLNEELQNVNNK